MRKLRKTKRPHKKISRKSDEICITQVKGAVVSVSATNTQNLLSSILQMFFAIFEKPLGSDN